MTRFHIRLGVFSVAAFVCLAMLCGCPAAPVPEGNVNENENTNDNSAADAPTAEIGYLDETGLNYRVLADGGVMPLYTSGQGASHMFATIRARGFPVGEDGTVDLTVHQSATLTASGRVLHDFTQLVRFEGIADGQVEVTSRTVVFNATPDEVDRQILAIDFTLTSPTDPALSARIQQTLLMERP